jgi:hypothetical protein
MLDNQREAILRWFSTLDVRQKHQDIRAVRTPETGQWLLDHEQFVTWQNDGTLPLWLRGPPGAGKTILASLAIDHIIEHRTLKVGHVGLAYFYCDYRREESMKTVAQTLSCLLRQFLELYADLPSPIVKLYATHKESEFQKQRPSADELCMLLASVITSFSQVSIVVDALDEYPSGARDKLLAALYGLQPAHLLVTSREHVLIGDVIPHHSCLPVLASQHDLALYVRSRFETFHLSRQIRRNPELQADIVNTIIGNAEDL